MSVLRISLEDEHVLVGPDRELSFGRDADLCIDTNPHLHRRLGVLRFHDGAWWLVNVGSAIALDICDSVTPSTMTIAPGASAPLPFATSTVRFSAGSSSYELRVDTPLAGGDLEPGDPAEGETTVTASRVGLNHEQRLLLVTLGQRRLQNPALAISELPTNRQVAASLGWSVTKFNRKLDNLCAKFDRLGVSGLKGDIGGLALNRRERLVEHVITVGLITAADLELLEEGQP